MLALHADTILLCGLSNARNTALYARNLVSEKIHGTVNIIASHPQDEDMVCAQYIQHLLSEADSINPANISARIRNSRAARKFFDPHESAFNIKDMDHGAREVDCDFVMQVDTSLPVPRLVRKPVMQSLPLTRGTQSATCHA